ncbi:MAG: peptidase inhibitor family I36 protein [Ktedonobacteraceae bacterium]
MPLSKCFFLLGSMVLMAALLLTFSPNAASAHAASVSASTDALTTAPSAVPANAFSCPSRSICLYHNENGTGARIACATSVCRSAWFSTTVGGVHAGSIFDNSGSIVWVADRQAGAEFCLSPGAWNLHHSDGFYWVEYGVGSCPGNIPPLP